jgi:hypothetical protein
MFAYGRSGQHIDMAHRHAEINPLVSQIKITSHYFIRRISFVTSQPVSRGGRQRSVRRYSNLP